MVYVIKTPVSLVLQDTTLNYFSTLVKLDFLKIVNLRLFVQNPCTERAQINLLYCYSGEEVISDIKIKIQNFILFIEKSSLNALKGANISFENDILIIKAPNVKGKNVYSSIFFKKKLLVILEKEVNPILLLHGGFVRFVGLIKNYTLLLEFGGSCTGCGLLSVTLEKTVKKIIKRNFPKIKKIFDYSKVNSK